MKNLIARTTIRLDKELKYLVEKMALEQGIRQQDVIRNALRTYLRTQSQKEAKRIILPRHDLGVKLDKITRKMIYDL